MTGYDWIVVGGGLAGSVLSYELVKAGFSVLLLEQDEQLRGATYYSYGGIAYWSATSGWMRTVCQESRQIYPTLSAELEHDIQFREIDLLLTIDPERDPAQVAAFYQGMLVEPQLISASQACAVEPLLNREAIAAALIIKHGHVEPVQTAIAYQQAMQRLGGTLKHEKVKAFIQQGQQIQGVITDTATHPAANVIVSTGGLSRELLRQVGVTVPVYFTHAEVVDIAAPSFRLNTLIMPAELKRSRMENVAGDFKHDLLWDKTDHELVPAILDVGAIQFMDGRLRLGQYTRALSNPRAAIDAQQSAAEICQGASHYLPALRGLNGVWGSSLVAFCGDRAPIIGSIPDRDGIHVFSGFSSPFAVLPPLAKRYASFLTGQSDDLIPQMAPTRFATVKP